MISFDQTSKPTRSLVPWRGVPQETAVSAQMTTSPYSATYLWSATYCRVHSLALSLLIFLRNMNLIFTVFFTTLIVTWILVLTKSWHGHLSFDSTSGVQKFHTQPTPRIGGIAMLTGLTAAYLFAPVNTREILGPMLLAGIPAFAVGLIEDITKKVRVSTRLFVTMVCGVVGWYITGVAMRNTGIPPLDWLLGFTPAAVLFTAFAVGGVANAVNIIDGFNGLAAGVVTIMLGAMGLIAFNLNDLPLASVCLLVAACTLGFGAINWPFGKIFLGDGGAYLLGFLVAWIAVLLPMRNPSITAWTTLLACAYPVLEVGFSSIRKLKRRGHHPGQPDKVHLHMLLHRRVARPLCKNASTALQNGMTSPLVWLYALLPASWAVLFAQNKTWLMVGLLLSIAVYAVVYTRLTRFKWPFFTAASRSKSTPT